MSDFKVGDKVKVTASVKELKDFLVSSTLIQTGEVYTVVQVDERSGNLRLRQDTGCTWVRPNMVGRAYPNPPHKHAELIKAWADGAEIEFYLKGHHRWVTVQTPFWAEDDTYRIKPSNPNADKIAELERTIGDAYKQIKELKESV